MKQNLESIQKSPQNKWIVALTSKTKNRMSLKNLLDTMSPQGMQLRDMQDSNISEFQINKTEKHFSLQGNETIDNIDINFS